MNTKINILSLAVLTALNSACSLEGNSNSSSSSGSASSSSSSSGDEAYINVKGGFFVPSTIGTKLYSGLRGHSNLVISQNTSELDIYVWGLTAVGTYQSALNEGTCASSKSYLYLFGKGGSVEPVINVGRVGMGTEHVSLPFAISETSLSLVIKDPGSEDVIACVDLNSSQGLKGPFVGGSSKSYINGEAYVSANDMGRSSVELNGMGQFVTGQPSYKAYVNTTECWGDNENYLQNTSGADAASNGLWAMVNVDTTLSEDPYGYAVSGWANSPFKVRLADTKSLVVRGVDASYNEECADLTTKILMFRSGSFKPTDAGVALYGSLSGRAILETSEEGVTTASIRMNGLKIDTTYHNHIHNGLCADAGGNHYLHDINGSDDSVNGMFPVFTSDGNGYVDYKLSVNKIVRPDARSIVIHEPGSGEKIACADLE